MGITGSPGSSVGEVGGSGGGTTSLGGGVGSVEEVSGAMGVESPEGVSVEGGGTESGTESGGDGIAAEPHSPFSVIATPAETYMQ